MNSIPIIPPVSAAWPATRCCKTVLVVDDFAPMCDLVARHLSASGYRVITANDPVEAQKIICSPAGCLIDLLLTDVNMPAMRGDELAAQCAEVRPRIRVVFMSPRGECMPAKNMAGFIEKPFSLADLGRVVRDALRTSLATVESGHRESLAA
ncbi:MAG: response regulator [Chthoniobacter sp.]|nr:response regulator [Chthoniobacter sp.]